jgi:hypothetical protein
MRPLSAIDNTVHTKNSANGSLPGKKRTGAPYRIRHTNRAANAAPIAIFIAVMEQSGATAAIHVR